MKFLLLTLLAFSFLPPISASSSRVEAGEWSVDFDAALAEAQRLNRPVLVNFTGSDWCVWCHRLRDEIFVTEAFKQFARDSLVLVELDFPRAKQQGEAARARNKALAEKYKVDGFPTVLLLDSSGRALGRTGYMEGGPKTFIRELKRMTSK
jgi:protein disulfide-isomerase